MRPSAVASPASAAVTGSAFSTVKSRGSEDWDDDRHGKD
jgi:hypothetical protein